VAETPTRGDKGFGLFRWNGETLTNLSLRYMRTTDKLDAEKAKGESHIYFLPVDVDSLLKPHCEARRHKLIEDTLKRLTLNEVVSAGEDTKTDIAR
jgi:hypothetical protein